jgi:uncharacterized membrane protein
MDKKLFIRSAVTTLSVCFLIFVAPIFVAIEFYLVLSGIIFGITYYTVDKLKPEDSVEKIKRHYREGELSDEEFERKIEQEL